MGKTQAQYIVDEKGAKSAVVLPIADYEELLEDLHDLAVIADRRDERTVTLDELKARLKTDGLPAPTASRLSPAEPNAVRRSAFWSLGFDF